MNTETFVTSLAEAAPTEAQLQRIGLSASDAERFRSGFRCVRRSTPLELTIPRNELTTLLSNWDVSKVEIGLIRFLSTPQSTTNGVQIGLVEIDPLVIEAETDQVRVIDHAEQRHVLWKVAVKPSNCLESFSIAARFLGRCGVREIQIDDFEAAESAAQKCASAAGGNEYLAFFSMLLGAQP